ncbi:bi-domain-containing oxidoreductase [Thalassotalea sediminis]|uniref:bi-domain-containing oxidoreductase n=1 Tax=Thalassotalea sediminis TaxID=1759089 RepID=UPI00257355F8|nr:bi-domain-containing oxidoreductase [Thalassotalea sediminis]
MKQILQNMGTGETTIVEAPAPQVKAGHVVITSSVSLISVGTERMLVDFGKASLIDKARQQPEKVKMVLDKIQTDGLLTTVDAVRSKLAQPLPLGYCHVGKVQSVGPGVHDINVNDRVVSNGPHADTVRIAKNLIAKIPDNVDDESAAFTVLASIGLQGIRLAKPTLGEQVVVIGAGLIGLLTIQLLIAQGCRVLAVDFDQQKLALAQQFGAETCNPKQGEDPIKTGLAFSRQQGVDAVIITASTSSSDPVSQAANMSRKRGRIVLVGVTGLELNRSEFYEKELSFQVSCSYGPGRYDDKYETQGHDYPLGFVRWTEQRNFIAILDMMAMGKLNVKPLISHRFLFEDALNAYQELSDNKSALGILLTYPKSPAPVIKTLTLNEAKATSDDVVIGFVGAGNYASRVLIPAFKAAHANLHTIATSTGVSSVIHGKNNGFLQATTDTDAMLNNDNINTIAIVTQHNSHATFVNQALANQKHVFVEKPLAINQQQHDSVVKQYQATDNQLLMVGFNRRFAPHIVKMKALLAGSTAPKSFIMTINAGEIPKAHWTQDPAIGGGRIIGEACHFIDLMRFLADSKISNIQAQQMGSKGKVAITEDKVAITLSFEDGSFGTIHYLANGAASFPKERIEVFAENKVIQLDNFRKMTGYGFKNFKKMNLWQQDKGQKACAKAFVDAIANGLKSPIPVEEIFEVSQATLNVAALLAKAESHEC